MVLKYIFFVAFIKRGVLILVDETRNENTAVIVKVYCCPTARLHNTYPDFDVEPFGCRICPGITVMVDWASKTNFHFIPLQL